jgi:hypothetical protein
MATTKKSRRGTLTLRLTRGVVVERRADARQPHETSLVLDECTPIGESDRPADCVAVYEDGPNSVLVVSYDRLGAEFEQLRTRRDVVTRELANTLLDRARRLSIPQLVVLK